jgi:hypothetical protein
MSVHQTAKRIRELTLDILTQRGHYGLTAGEMVGRCAEYGFTNPEYSIRPRLTELTIAKFCVGDEPIAMRTAHRRMNDRGSSESVYVHRDFWAGCCYPKRKDER